MPRSLNSSCITTLPLSPAGHRSSGGDRLRGPRQRPTAISRWSTAAIVVAAVLVSCSHGAQSDASGNAAALPDACEQYFASYATCMKAIGQNPDVLDERIASARRTLAGSASDADALSARCKANTNLLSTACR
jgi:hypothetical protein